MKANVFKWLGSLLLMVVAIVTGAASGVMMADAVAMTDGGKTIDGALTATAGADAVPDLYMSDVDKRITKIRPMATPIDQISRYSKAEDASSMEVKYYSVGTKPIRTILTAAVTAQASGTTVALSVENPSMFDERDTIRVVGVKGYKEDGATVAIEDLVLRVMSADTNGNPVVSAVNGKANADGLCIWLPAIANGATLIRMGRACGELDAQSGVFSNLPTSETQYCQNFMIQVEQSTFDQMWSEKEVDWTFSDLEEDSVFDMRLGMENTTLFGAKSKINHPLLKNQNLYFTGGLWWMAGKDIIVGAWDPIKGETVISDDNLVDLCKESFTGVGAGNKRKVLVAGSNLVAAFSKIKSEKYRMRDSVEAWNLKFKSFDTNFGEILLIHGELFDINDMSDYGFLFDPSFLTKKVFLAFKRSVLDLKQSGQRNSKAVVLQEVSCMYLRYKKAHARIRLAPEGTLTPIISCEPSDLDITATTAKAEAATIVISGVNLTAAVTATLTGTDKALFTKAGTLSAAGGTLVITYTPVAAGTHVARLTLSSTGAEDVVISLQGTAAE